MTAARWIAVVVILWFCIPAAGAWEFDIHAGDTEQVVRAQVIEGDAVQLDTVQQQ